MSIADTCNEGNKVGEVVFNKDTSIRKFLGELTALSKSLLDLQSDSGTISSYMGQKFAYQNEPHGDPGSLYRDGMRSSAKNIAETDSEKVDFLYDLTVACLESMEVQNPNGRSVVASKQIVDKDYRKENPLILVTGYNSEQPVFKVQGITEVISDVMKAEGTTFKQYFGCLMERKGDDLYFIPSLK